MLNWMMTRSNRGMTTSQVLATHFNQAGWQQA